MSEKRYRKMKVPPYRYQPFLESVMDITLLTSLFDIKTYLKLFFQLAFPVLACPRCKKKEKIIKHGRYHRRAIDVDGSKYLIPIQRFRCKTCGKTFSCFLSRYNPYCIQVISPLIEAYFKEYVSKEGRNNEEESRLRRIHQRNYHINYHIK
jgi:transposase-like protein